MKMITPELIWEGLVSFRQHRHGNKGYAQNEDGSYINGDDGEAIHMGYTWTWICLDNPRLSVVDHIMHPAHDRPEWVAWCVDGEEKAGVAEACSALLIPPLLTLGEYVVLERIGDFPCTFEDAVNRAAGSVNPTPGFLEDQWSMCSAYISRLVDKGIIRYNSDTHELEIVT